jgi:hypothetical protein
MDMKVHTKEELMAMPMEDLVGMIMMMEGKHGAACKAGAACKTGATCKTDAAASCSATPAA